MIRRSTWAVAALSILLTACATPPQPPVPMSAQALTPGVERIGVAMTTLPKVEMQYPGAGCLLCLGAAALTNRNLSAHVETLSTEELPQLKADIAKLLKSRGLDAKVIESPLDLSKLPAASNQGRRDFSSLKSQYQVDRLVVLEVQALGAIRNYASYIPSGDPKAVMRATGYMVDLKTNALDWYLPVNIEKSADQKWDEPPKFPSFTNAYYQALEAGKDELSKPFAK